MTRRTKIVATIGPPRGGDSQLPLVDPHGLTVDKRISYGELLRWLLDAGVNVVRLNMSFAHRGNSYGANEKDVCEWLHAEKESAAQRVAILGDLPGPKIRLVQVQGVPADGLVRGARFILNFSSKHAEGGEPGATVRVNGKPFEQEVKGIGSARDIGSYVRAMELQGAPVFFVIGDGKVWLQAKTESHGRVTCDVVSGGEVPEGKGLTIKKADLAVSAFGEEDKKALDFLLENGRDLLAYVAVSFVQSADDILRVKKHIADWTAKRSDERGLQPPGVIAKIETQRGWSNIDSILDVADGVMVARGDLGEQLQTEEVPHIQKELIRKCNVRGRPVITATQMLDSMERNPQPTRAEATDIFNAIMDGTDAVMLSGETSRGAYPVQAVRVMANIAQAAENHFLAQIRSVPESHRFDAVYDGSRAIDAARTTRVQMRVADEAAASTDPNCDGVRRAYHTWAAGLYGSKLQRCKEQPTTDAICRAACMLSEASQYKAIIAPTTSGRTVFMISRFRPEAPIIGAAHDERTFRKLLLSYGVSPVYIGSGIKTVGEVLDAAVQAARNLGLLRPGDAVVATAGSPLYLPGTTNLIQIVRVEEPPP